MDIETPTGDVLSVEVAATRLDRKRGLSNRQDIGDGMLFCYDDARQLHFWMLDMLSELDVVWILGGQVVGVDSEVPVYTDGAWSVMSSPGRADAALEVAAGRAEELGIERGLYTDEISEICNNALK